MAKNKYVYGCEECGRGIDSSEPSAVMFKITVTRERPLTLGPDEDGNTVACLLPEPLGAHPAHVARRTVQLCERCVGSDLLRRFAPPLPKPAPAEPTEGDEPPAVSVRGRR
jgi:hypothetical protein